MNKLATYAAAILVSFALGIPAHSANMTDVKKIVELVTLHGDSQKASGPTKDGQRTVHSTYLAFDGSNIKSVSIATANGIPSLAIEIMIENRDVRCLGTFHDRGATGNVTEVSQNCMPWLPQNQTLKDELYSKAVKEVLEQLR